MYFRSCLSRTRADGLGLLVLAILLVRRQPHPVSGWAIWTVLMLVPFALLTDSILLALHVGPSRYLYFASAGSSLVLAWGLQNLALRFGGQRAFAGALLALGAVSYISLKQAEGLTYYSEARSYLSSGNVRTGIEQMRKALDLAGSALYREDAYARLCLAELDQPEQGAATIAAPILQSCCDTQHAAPRTRASDGDLPTGE